MATRACVLVLSVLALGACNKAEVGESTPPPDTETAAAEVEVVKNIEAKVGDTTTCPFSGRNFEVKADHPQVEYEGNTYWVCSENAAEAVRADPAKYLADFDG